MAKIILSCKHCHKPFIVDWDVIVERRTASGYRKFEQESEVNVGAVEEISLDLPCPVCGKRASYRRSEGEEV